MHGIYFNNTASTAGVLNAQEFQTFIKKSEFKHIMS